MGVSSGEDYSLFFLFCSKRRLQWAVVGKGACINIEVGVSLENVGGFLKKKAWLDSLISPSFSFFLLFHPFLPVNFALVE